MTLRYLILEAGEFVGDGLFDLEGALNELPTCKSGTTVWAVLSSDPAHPLEVTAGLIETAAGRWTATEIRESVLGDYIVLPVSREEQRADDADARRGE